jgi:tetratricopeptide (TPR) repeat protein
MPHSDPYPHLRATAAREALEAGLRAEHGDDLQRALHHYADAAIRAGDDPAVVAQALTRQAGVYRRLSEWDLAASYARRARELADGAGLDDLRADALVAEGNALMCNGQLDAAEAVYHRLVRVAMNDRQRGIAMQNIGSIHAQKREFEWAAEAFIASRALFQSAGYTRGEAIATNNLGRLALDTGDFPDAEQLLCEALTRAREVQDAELAALARLNLAQLRVAQGTLGAAAEMVAEAYGHFAVSENRWRQIECLCVFADIAEAEGQVGQARMHLERGREIALAINARLELERIEARLAAT